jgi:TonB family protein
MPIRSIVLLVCSMPFGAALAQDAAALSRAQRDADNPLRMIIEASKIKPRARASEADKAAVREPEKVQVRARVAPADTAPLPTPAKPAAAEAPSQVNAAPAPESPAATVATPPEPVSAPEPPRAVPESQVREVVVPAPAETRPAAAEPLAPLQLTNLVEPSVPRRLIGKVRGDVEVVVSFTVLPDGSVGSPAVQQSNHPLMNQTVLDAVAQWRYAPIAQARQHAVQLLMRAGD